MLRFSAIAFFCCIAISAFSQRRTLSPEKIGKLLPAKVKGFYLSADAKNSLIEIGTLRYSLAERSYAKRSKSIKILLFDYAEAPIMYNQAIRKWQQMDHIENDSIIFRPYSHPDSSAWESFFLTGQRSQIIMGINKRFYLSFAGEKLSLAEMKEILQLFPFEKYPK